MIKISEFKVIDEFLNGLRTYGLYQCKLNGETKFFTRNGSTFKLLVHYYDHDELEDITEEVSEAIWKALVALMEG